MTQAICSSADSLKLNEACDVLYSENDQYIGSNLMNRQANCFLKEIIRLKVCLTV